MAQTLEQSNPDVADGEAELITLDALEAAEQPSNGNGTTAEPMEVQQQPQKRPVVMAKKSKAMQQRDAKRLAIAQHASRRINREHYDPSKLEKKHWREHGFPVWLAFLKAKWRMQREARSAALSSALLLEATGEEVPTASIAGTLARREQNWQILQV